MIDIWFIINPNAGTNRNKQIADLVNQVFDTATYRITFKPTAYAGHAISIAQEAVANKVDIVVAVGGDGSVNEVAQGVINQHHTLLGILPLGSGNGLARSLKIPTDTMQALQIIKQRQPLYIDTALINDDTLMLSNVGVGFDTAVAKDFAHNKKRGLLTYVKLVTQNILNYKPKQWEVHIDGKPLITEAFMLNVANANQFGYNFAIDPTGEITDGQLELVVIKPFPLPMGAEIAIRGFTNTIHNSNYTAVYAGKKFEFKHIDQGFYQVDGDFKALNTNTLTITIQPKSLRVIVP